MSTYNKPIVLKKKWPLALAVILLLVLGAVIWLFVFKPTPVTHKTSAGKPGNTISYNKPTKQEAEAGNEQKQQNVERQTINNAPTSTPPSATVVFADANQYDNTVEVRAYIPNIYEAGTCTATFTKTGQQTVITNSAAFKDASTTQCGANDTPRSKFGQAGSWQLSVKYTSASGIIGSATSTVNVK